MIATIRDADSEVIRTFDPEELTKQLAEEFALQAPTLLEGALSISVEEAQVDVSGDFRFGVFGPEPTYVAGIRASYYVPYSGNREMFHCVPSTRNRSVQPVELGDEELTFTFERPDQDIPSTKTEFDREVSQIRESLEWLRQDCQNFNATLPIVARQHIDSRRERLTYMTQGVQDLGLPIRKAATTTLALQANPTVRVTREREATTRKIAETYDIALSFAGENRPYVEEVAPD
jgi:hypothetical protein